MIGVHPTCRRGPAPSVLEAEAVHIVREVAAELERPVVLFSGGKDAIVLLRLCEKAFAPVDLPLPVLHVDTGHNPARRPASLNSLATRLARSRYRGRLGPGDAKFVPALHPRAREMNYR